MQIHPHEVKILQIHNARPEFVKNNHGYYPIRIQHFYIRCNYHENIPVAKIVNINTPRKKYKYTNTLYYHPLYQCLPLYLKMFITESE